MHSKLAVYLVGERRIQAQDANQLTTPKARITKKSLLTRYAAGERNFRSVDLSSLNLSSAHLLGADFTGSDIRGTNFTNANLSGAQLTNTQGGISESGAVIQIGLAILLPIVANLSVLAAHLVSLLLCRDSAVVAFYPVILCFGFTLAALISRDSAHKNNRKILGVLLALVFSLPFLISGKGYFLGFALTQAVGITSVFLMSIPFFGNRKGVVYTTAGSSAVYALMLTLSELGKVISQMYPLWTAILLLCTFTLGKQEIGPLHKLLILHRLTRAFSMLGTTSFRGANLSDAVFNGAHLGRVDFSSSRQKTTNLRGTCWKDVHQLHTAYFGPDFSKERQAWHDFSN